jgi:hypothetical protein
MTSRQARLLVAGLAVFLISLIIQVPADRLLYLFRDNLPATISWQSVSGTVFTPSFHNLVIYTTDNHRVLIESADLHISLLPLMLGRLKLQFNLTSPDSHVSGVAIVRRHDWEIPELEGRLALRTLSGLSPWLEMSGADALVSFSGNKLAGEFQRLPASGELKLMLEDLQIKMLGTEGPLGDYSLQLQTIEEAGVSGSVDTASADARLKIQGRLVLDPISRLLRFEGKASVAADAPESVASILPMLGPVTDGYARIDWQTKL